jgi:hypothetical protein
MPSDCFVPVVSPEDIGQIPESQIPAMLYPLDGAQLRDELSEISR